ncbi:MAG: respiratory nitrate reductase subunit gamma, partial [Desulfobacterales bacterium]|nr:respiratory nitrate reductase subunit gamma [Desulfobacterales bacterium]
SAEDEACMVCHRLVMPDEPQASEKISNTCFHCHAKGGAPAQELTARKVALIDPGEYRSWPHSKVACTLCHPLATDFNHGRQEPGDCRQCHTPHDEKAAHDLHSRVACGACHLQGIQPFLDGESGGGVLWKRVFRAGETSRIHHMGGEYDEGACRRCHEQGNPVGAVSMILPAKGILCMPCHAATFSAGDMTTVLSLVVFFLGIMMIFAYALSGTIPGRPGAGPFTKLLVLLGQAGRALFSPRISLVVRAVILDVLLQRRLYRQSAKRWAIHAMIFFPFLIRFSWGLIGLAGSLWKPEWPWIRALLDKNHPMTGFLFDVTGIIMVLGLLLAFIRGRGRQAIQPAGLPRQDRLALGLIGGIVVVGFILEGIRIAMTGNPGGAGYAFLGYAIGRLFGQSSALTGVYGYVWYVHTILTGAFVAYLPFSRLVHIIIAPLILVRKTLAEGKDKKG